MAENEKDLKTNAGATASTGVKTLKAKTIEVNEDTLRELIEQNKQQAIDIEQLKNSSATNTGNSMIITKKREHGTTPKISRWNGKIFLGYENIGTSKSPRETVSEFNPQTRESINFCNILLMGEKKSIRVPHIDFLRERERETVKLVKKIEMEDSVIEQGMVYKKDFTENGYGMVETTVQVPLEVISKVYRYVVKTDAGEEIELPESALN